MRRPQLLSPGPCLWMCPEMLGGKAKCRSGSGSDGDESEGLMDAEDSTKGKNKGLALLTGCISACSG